MKLEQALQVVDTYLQTHCMGAPRDQMCFAKGVAATLKLSFSDTLKLFEKVRNHDN